MTWHRNLLLFGVLLLPSPSLAQPVRSPGPWAADADGDGRITREEMRAWMEQRFKLMDPDGDGFVSVEAMQRMLGHERQDGDRTGQRPAGHEGQGRGGMRRGGHGGPPPGDRPFGGQARGSMPAGPPGWMMPYPEDANDDGKIDLDEFVAPALAMFDELDRNGDGVLTADELPPPRRHEQGPEE